MRVGVSFSHHAIGSPPALHPDASFLYTNQRRESETLVTRADLEDLLAHIGDLAPFRSFIEKRWIGMVMWWDQRSRDARWKYFTLRLVVVLGGVTIPVLSTLSLLTDWHTSIA